MSWSATSSDIWPVVIALGKGGGPSARQLQQLLAWEQQEAWVWQLPADDSAYAALRSRITLLQQVVSQVESGEAALPLPDLWTDWVQPLWKLWLPLAQRLDEAQRRLGQPFVQGIVGGQGTGKTTLTKILQLILGCLGHQTVCLSIDDLYLSYAERCELKAQDPRLIWRGPPGTHDVGLGVATLAALKQPTADQVVIPQFDKSLHGGQGDRVEPLVVPAPTIVLFEGWFLGAQPLEDHVLAAPDFGWPAPIVTEADRQFAQTCNQRLRAYSSLWEMLDSLIVLYPEDYRQSQRWRQEAEAKMKATGKSGLSEAEIADFVTYFWKALHPALFITPLTNSIKTSLVVNICQNHCLGELSAPFIGNADSV